MFFCFVVVEVSRKRETLIPGGSPEPERKTKGPFDLNGALLDAEPRSLA